MKFYTDSTQDVLNELQSSDSGLSSAQASERLERYGRNKLRDAKKTSLIKRFFEQLKDPMIIILIIAAIVSAVVSFYEKESFADTIIIIAVVLLNAILGVLQESKAEKAIEALQSMNAAQSKVLRDGMIRLVKSEELVPGDVVLLEAGDAVPADGRIIECASLKIEEAALTGESVPVTKQAEIIEDLTGRGVSLGDRVNMCYMGSTVVYGRGYAVITSTGMDTEMGKIADAIEKAEQGATPLQIKLSQLSKILTYIVLGVCVFMFAFSLLTSSEKIGFELIMNTFMIAVSLAVAAIPEGLATVVTISLSIGVTKMSKRNAVIRKLTAVETLGCTQVICSDKTGTLTLNRMTVVRSASLADGKHEAAESGLSPAGKLLACAMSLCSDAEPDESGSAMGEPTECALVNYASMVGFDKRQLKKDYPRIGEAPFDSVRKMMSTIHVHNGEVVQYTKGAPDEIVKHCTHYFDGEKAVPLTDEFRKKILADNKGMADDALRVLAAAMRLWDDRPFNVSPSCLEHDLVFIGLVGMIDPVRSEAISAVQECRRAGIRPIMITGDHKDTAVAIAKQLGIITDESQAITGTDLGEMSDDELYENIEKYSVYARVQPEHKVRIVSAWQRKGRITAMTGDGVNDAASIKTADIGVGMGITGTDVTKNVADMVLADDNFATIVSAVEEGRRIYDNIRKSIQFLLASNASEVLSIFFATLLGFTILEPVHLLWINLITDCLPALSLAMEDADDDIMSRPPRKAKEGIFAGGMGFDIAYQGIMVSALVVIAYMIGHYIELGTWSIWHSGTSLHGMTMAFLTMNLTEIFHSFNMRSLHGSIFKKKGQNLYLWGSLLIALVLTCVVVFVPSVARVFSLADNFGLDEFAIAVALSLMSIVIVEIVKFIQRRVRKNHN